MGRASIRNKPGNYYLQFELPGGYRFTAADVGGDDLTVDLEAFDSDADDRGETVSFAIQEAVTDLDWDAGVVELPGRERWAGLVGRYTTPSSRSCSISASS